MHDINLLIVIPLTGFGVFASVFYTAKRNDEHITNRDKYAVLVAGMHIVTFTNTFSNWNDGLCCSFKQDRSRTWRFHDRSAN